MSGAGLRRSRLLAATALSSLAVALSHPLPAAAVDLPVKAPRQIPLEQPQPGVDGVNWKLGGLGGSVAERGLYGGVGSLSIPLNGPYGLQIDGSAGTFDSRFFGATAGHLFARDPLLGLVGLYGSYTRWNNLGGLEVVQLGGETEFYVGRFTLSGVAGVEFGNSRSVSTGVISNGLVRTETFDIFDVETRFFDKINLSFYFTENLKGYIGHRYQGGKHALALGGEWAFRTNTPYLGALFVEARAGEDDFQGVWGGLRVYYGAKDKSLMRRHREDDPIEWIPEPLFSITNSATSSAVQRSLPQPPTCVIC